MNYLEFKNKQAKKGNKGFRCFTTVTDSSGFYYFAHHCICFNGRIDHRLIL